MRSLSMGVGCDFTISIFEFPIHKSFRMRSSEKKWGGGGCGADLRNGGLGTLTPKKVSGKADRKQNYGRGQVLELGGVAKSQIHRIADDGSGGKDKENRRPWVSRHAIRNGSAAGGTAEGKNGSGSQAIKNPAD